MESILRAAFVYIFLLILLRIIGNRTLTEMNTFDLVLLLIMGDASQQAITSNDYSVTNAVIIITTLIALDMTFNILKQYFPTVDRLLDGSPIILVRDGKCLKKIMDRTKTDETDVLEAARRAHGLERLDQIKYAILEKDGDITIIPNKK